MAEDDPGPELVLTFGSFFVQESRELPHCSSQEEAAAAGDRSSLENPVKVEGEGQEGHGKGQAGDQEEKGDAASAKAGKCQEKKRKHCQFGPQDPEVPTKAKKPGTDSTQGPRGLKEVPGLTGICGFLSLHPRCHYLVPLMVSPSRPTCPYPPLRSRNVGAGRRDQASRSSFPAGRPQVGS